MAIFEFQADGKIKAPELPGIYAWYYRPLVFGTGDINKLSKLITTPSCVKTEIGMRYGLTWETDSDVNILYSAKRKTVDEFLLGTFDKSGELIRTFFLDNMVPHFTKPLYIGIDRKNLRERILKHRDLLDKFWNSESPIHQYISANPDATVEDVIKNLKLYVPDLDVTHTFALNARVKGLTLRDLVVYVYPIEKQDELSDLEKILQLISDPICGKR